MKKIYDAPVLELLAFCSATAISGESEWLENPEDEAINSQPWNDGELGWT